MSGLSRGKCRTDENKTNWTILAATERELLTIKKFKMAVCRQFGYCHLQDVDEIIGNLIL